MHSETCCHQHRASALHGYMQLFLECKVIRRWQDWPWEEYGVSTAPTPSVKSKRSRASAESSEGSEQVKMPLAFRSYSQSNIAISRQVHGVQVASQKLGWKSTSWGKIEGQSLHSNLCPAVKMGQDWPAWERDTCMWKMEKRSALAICTACLRSCLKFIAPYRSVLPRRQGAHALLDPPAKLPAKHLLRGRQLPGRSQRP